ncbi:MAG: tetratricopeptide repeat protein [Promethearchaeota archaeon]
MESVPIQEEQKPSWDIKYEKAQERIKESFWGDFVFGGLLISGIFIIVDNLNFPQITNIILGFLIIILAGFLMLGRLKWLKSIPNRINKKMVQSKIFFESSNYTKSLSYLEKIIKIDEKYDRVWNNKGMVLSKLGRREDAIECYNKAIEIEEKFDLAWYNKGTVLFKLGKIDEAIKCLNKAIEIDEKFVFAWNNMGIILSKSGRKDEAIDCYNKAIEIEERYAHPWYNKACIESLRNNKQTSLINLKKAIEIDNIFKEKAKLDPDFDNIRDSDEFKELTG